MYASEAIVLLFLDATLLRLERQLGIKKKIFENKLMGYTVTLG